MLRRISLCPASYYGVLREDGEAFVFDTPCEKTTTRGRRAEEPGQEREREKRGTRILYQITHVEDAVSPVCSSFALFTPSQLYFLFFVFIYFILFFFRRGEKSPLTAKSTYCFPTHELRACLDLSIPAEQLGQTRGSPRWLLSQCNMQEPRKKKTKKKMTCRPLFIYS